MNTFCFKGILTLIGGGLFEDTGGGGAGDGGLVFAFHFLAEAEGVSGGKLNEGPTLTPQENLLSVIKSASHHEAIVAPIPTCEIHQIAPHVPMGV